ncbi:DUF1993 domain-containing protein [Dokdonella immobilis]|uniref:DUF1993 domain-containing protein n=1 Tax=Dokdonella immobilis TaxID=578942 RepID=A0A1I4V323_9GAMM|nr:DUF1993 domain-containing protein [Dokdonella immobilis]SFM95523.1 hypothetical protein SAMN05216289_10163 [Dokdonella immobilis]
MTISMYQASVPVFVRSLGNLSAILAKAAAHAEANKIDPAVLLATRLYPDMFPLSRQIQIATDMAKGAAARLAGVERPVHEDNEATFADMQARIEKTLDFIRSIKPEQIDGSEEKAITLTLRGNDVQFAGQPYLLHFVLPNLFFHTATAYAILRHCGVALGKPDFIGGIPG